MGRGPICVASAGLAAVLGCHQSGGATDGAPADAVADSGSGATTDVPAPCDFSVGKNELSAKIPTVGVVEWSLAGGQPASARIVYQLANADSSLLNHGGTAPVDLTRPNHRTLLLGLKQGKDYTFHIEAVRDGQACVSPDFTLPTTGKLTISPSVTVQVTQAGKRRPGFIVTSSGQFVPNSAFIIDADGEIVWSFAGPESTTRALMDYEGQNMWMLALNLLNEGGEMRYVSMDGLEERDDVPGMAYAHHDFTVMPGGKVAALAWASPGNDPASEVLIRSPDGTTTSPFLVGQNVFGADGYYHANAIHYLESDDSFTIADRDMNALVKVGATGRPDWQIGGTCVGASTGDRCLPQTWQVNHGHHFLDDGTLLLFNNGDSGVNHILQFAVDGAGGAFTATLVQNYAGDGTGNTMGDVQRLPGGNTLVTYSLDGRIVELDPSWNKVQTFSVRVGYSSWRPTLYGPPARL